MPAHPVDRGNVLQGVNRTVRDSRVPFNVLRAMSNYRLPDGRAVRRDGFKPYNTNRIRGVQLAKATGSGFETSAEYKTTGVAARIKTPNSYGLLRWHDDYQPKSTRDWSVEFLLTLGEEEPLVKKPIDRQTTATVGGSIRSLRGKAGVFVYDQTVLASEFSYEGTAVGDAQTFALSSLVVSFTSTSLDVGATLIDGSNNYDLDKANLTHAITYVVGAKYHIGVTYATSTRKLTFYVDGVERDSYTLLAGEKFAGEADAINGNTSVIQRDIVLLNEFTVRGSLATTTRVNDGSALGIARPGFQVLNAALRTDGFPNPWCCTPGEGTAMAELRIWHEERTGGNLQSNMLKTINPASSNLKGYWHLDDGGPLCFDSTSSNRVISIHHSGPSYVGDDGLVGNSGLYFADGQHLKKEFIKAAGELYVEDSHIYLEKMFEHYTTDRLRSGNDFTVQVQIRTPHTFQQELNTRASSATYSPTSTKGESRQMPEAGTFRLFDGGTHTGTPTREEIQDDSGAVRTEGIFHRAFNSTLWSVEAQGTEDGADEDNLAQIQRVPLARGSLTPSGLVEFEYYVHDENDDPRQMQMVSSTALTANTVYTLTFRRRTLFQSDGVTVDGFEMAIFIDTATTADQTLAAQTSGGDITISSTSCMRHGGVREVLIGSSYVNDFVDRSAGLPATGSVYGGLQVPMRANSPYQDTPGFFTLGYFRMWADALEPEDISRLAGKTMKNAHEFNSLLYNLEIDEMTGDAVKSKSRFPTLFQMGYKSWTHPTAFVSGDLQYSVQGFWSSEDCLGYRELPSEFNDEQNQKEGECRGLAFFTSTLAQSFGLVANFDDALFFDTSLSGSLKSLPIQRNGLLADYIANERWRGTTIGDRTILTSPGGSPKVFNGRICTTAGFRQWTGPYLEVDINGSGSAALTPSKWYGLVLIYNSEEYGIQHIGPRQVLNTGSGYVNPTITLKNIPSHPDPRVTSLTIAMTAAQESLSLAQSASVSPLDAGPLANKYHETYLIDAEPTLSAADLNQSALPVVSLSASANDRLYLSGDPLIGDIVYWTDKGNPEKIDILTNRLVLEESSGDRVIGLVSMFGSVFALKPNSIWRIVEVDPVNGLHQRAKVAPIGPASEDAWQLVTLPDTGRVALVFWSLHGPYIFDGVNVRYIGYPAEGSDPYSHLDPKSVFVIHSAETRELVFVHKSVANGVTKDRHDSATVYDYRNNSMYNFDYLVGTFALTVDFAKHIFAGSTSDVADAVLSRPHNHLALVGGSAGYIYTWGQQEEDGLVNVGAGTQFTVSVYAAGEITITESPWTATELRGLWVTVVRANYSEWFTLPIKTNGVNTITLDTDYAAASFTPVADDIIYVALPPAEIEFPWDVMDQPWIDKNVRTLTLWFNQNLYYRYATNWSNNYTAWSQISDSGDKRDHTELYSSNCEAFKLELASFAKNSEIDAYAYRVEYQRDANVVQ